VISRWASGKVKLGYTNCAFGLKVSTLVKVRVKVRVRFKIRFYDFVAVPSSGYPAELPPVHESS
jgi:hypothetical protein